MRRSGPTVYLNICTKFNLALFVQLFPQVFVIHTRILATYLVKVCDFLNKFILK